MGKAKELGALAKRIVSDLDCPLASGNLVFGKGNADADIFFVGEAPGAKEEELGIPFVGAAGKTLDKYLHDIGLTMEDVYIANILKYRPPNNRNPSKEEIKRHTPFLLEQIRIVDPKIICTLGNFSSKFILSGGTIKNMNKISGIGVLHGKTKTVLLAEQSVKVFPLYHPAALLYNRKLKSEMKKDMKLLQHYITQ